MEQEIIYSEYDDRLLVTTEDLITLISERLEGFYSIATMHRFKDLLGYLKCFKDYSYVTKIVKPGSNANEIYSMCGGIMIASHDGGYIKSVFYKGGFSTGNKKVMIFVPCDMLRYLITKVRNPKQLLWQDTAIREAFNSVDVTFANKIRKQIDTAVERAKHNDWCDTFRYWMSDVLATQEFYEQMEETMRPRLRIKNVIFNDPATIVFWYDGTKTVVKAQEGDTFDPEKGLAMAICKKILGTNGSQSNFNDIFKKWLPKEEKKESFILATDCDLIPGNEGIRISGNLTAEGKSLFSNLGILGHVED